VPRWGSGGFVVDVDDAGTGLTLSEPVTFAPATVHKIMLRKKTSAATAPITVTAGADAFHVVLASPIDPDDFAFDPKKEPPLFTFGVESLVNRLCVVTSISPAEDDQVEIIATAYRAEPHSHDEATPPDLGNTSGSLPPTNALPSVSGLVVSRSPDIPNQVIATWIPAAGAQFYILQLSYDGVAYETLSDYIVDTSFRFAVLPRLIYVRVAAVTTGAGAWAYWTGQAPVQGNNVVPDNGVTPGNVTGVVVSSGIEELTLRWIPPANTPLLETEIWEGVWPNPSTPPATPNFANDLPTFSVLSPQAFYFRRDLAEGSKRSYWLRAKGKNLRVGAVTGPHTATVVVWPRIADIEGGLEDEVNARTLAVANEANLRATADSGLQANINTEATVRQTNDNNISANLSTEVAARVAGDSTLAASVTTEATARASGDGTLGAEYVLKVVTGGAANRRIAGFRVTNYGGGGNETEIVLQADKVAVVNASGDNIRAPFSVIEGLTYINTALIKEATIQSAMIDSVIADKIAAGKISALISLFAAKINTGAAYYRDGDGHEDSTFPPVTPASASQPNYADSTNPLCVVTFYGWKSGSGYARDRYGRPDTPFLLMFSGSVDHYVSLWWRHAFSDGSFGSWAYVPDSQQIEPAGGYGSVGTHAVVVPGITAGIGELDGDVAIQFGVRGTNSAGGWQDSGQRNLRGCLSVMCFNG